MTFSGVRKSIVAGRSAVPLSEVLSNSVTSAAAVSVSGVPMISVASRSFGSGPYLFNGCISVFFSRRFEPVWVSVFRSGGFGRDSAYEMSGNGQPAPSARPRCPSHRYPVE